MRAVFPVLVLFAAFAQANVLRVPNDYSTIVTAMAASQEGDTVLVDRGLYHERVVFPAGARTLVSNYIFTQDSADIQWTILEPDTLGSADSLTMIEIQNPTTSVTVAGFTMQHGHGVYLPPIDGPSGGAVFLRSGSLHIDHCVLQQNATQFGGSAVFADSGATLTVTHCEFHHNTTQVGGIWMKHATLRISHSHIHHNEAMWGAAIWTWYCPRIDIDSCLVDSNRSSRNVTAVVDLVATPGTVTHSDFIANGTDTTTSYGAAVIFGTDTDSALVDHCRFIGNTGRGALGVSMEASLNGVVSNCLFEGSNGVYGSTAMVCGRYTTNAVNCVFRDNVAVGVSVMSSVPNGHVYLLNCEFLSNVSISDRGAAISGFLSTWTASQCSFANNQPRAVTDTVEPVGIMHMENCWWGDPSGPYHATLNPGGLGDVILGDSVYFIPWLTEPPQAVPERPRSRQPESHLLLMCYPNPFNPSATISFVLPRAGSVSLRVYDLTGRQVQALVDQVMNAGEYQQTFDGSALPSGIYFARLQGKGFSRTQKLVLLK